MDKYIIITFPLQQHLASLKDMFSVFVSFVLVAICISKSFLGNSSFTLEIVRLLGKSKYTWK